MIRRYLLPRETIDADVLAEALCANGAFSASHRTDERPAPGLRVRSIISADSKAVARLVDDEEIAGQYVLVEADGAEAAHAAALAILHAVRIVPPSELFAEASRTYAEQPATLLRAAYGSAGTAEPAFLQILDAASRHVSPAVRRYAYQAASLTQWPEALVLLNRAAALESDPHLADFARHAIGSLALVLTPKDF